MMGTRTRMTGARERAMLNVGTFAREEEQGAAQVHVETDLLREERSAMTVTCWMQTDAACHASWKQATCARCCPA